MQSRMIIDQCNGTEYWWNVATKRAVKVRYNRSDLVICKIENKNCQIIDFSYPTDENVTKKAAAKLEIYDSLIQSRQLTYLDFKLSFFPVITRALGTVLKDLHKNIKQLDFNKKDSNDIVNATRQRVALSTVKICKTF